MKTNSIQRCCLLVTLLLAVFINQTKAQDYLQVRFSSNAVVATATNSGDSLLLSFNDPNLTAAFSGRRITTFIKEFPTISAFSGADADTLNRVYKIVCNGSYSSLRSAIQSAASTDLDDFSLENFPISLYTPSDYYNCGACGPWERPYMHLDLTNAKGAWDITRGLSCIKIAITDESFVHHDDLDNKVVTSSNTVNIASINAYGPSGSHGVAVAALAGAETNNTLSSGNIASLGNKVMLMYYNNGYDDFLKAVLDGCKVINCSWLDHMSSTLTPNRSVQKLINLIHNQGVTIVAAAGNNNSSTPTDYAYPASYNNVISVTSVGTQNERGVDYANWKDCHQQYFFPIGHPNYAANSTQIHQHNDKVDICAPGYYIETLNGNNSTMLNTGTSLASPQVAAAAALVYSLNPNFTPDNVEYFLKTGAHNIDNLSENAPYYGQLGAGRLDAGAALQLAASSNIGGCQPIFTDINWYRQDRSGAYVGLTNNWDAFTYLAAGTNNNLQFTISGATTNVEWEFYLNGVMVPKTGTTVTINWNEFIDPVTNSQVLINNTPRAPMFCINTLEVYVRQGSGCCYSAYYKETAENPNVDCTAIRAGKATNKQPQLAIIESKLRIYPSPANSFINVMADESILKTAIQYQIIGIDGKTAQAGKLTSSSSLIDISKLAKGVYLFKTAKGNVKFIKE